MKNKKVQKSLKIYGIIGKALCACAGGIVGFVLGGPLVAVVGTFCAAIASDMLEKTLIKAIA